MHPSLKYDHHSVIEQNVSYYDKIAEHYDEIMEQDEGNRKVREKVAYVFNKLIASGLVLDFGGGTGKDLGWLIEKGYNVIFCEPSVKMREKAIFLSKKNLLAGKVVFLDDEASDFTAWQTRLPFPQTTDAVLSNFAVINSIPDLKSFFKNLSLVIRPGGHLLMLVLSSYFRKRWQANRLATLLSLFTSTTVTATVRFNQQEQKVYLYSTSKIARVAKSNFHFQSRQSFKENGFELLHFTRK